MAKKPCTSCHKHDKAKRRTKCMECWLRTQPVTVQAQASRERRRAMPPPWRLSRVPKEDWPEGRRWCSGCQSFVLLKDVTRGASRCKTCLGISAHAANVQRTYGITGEQYEELYRMQGGRCYICRRKMHSKRLAVDHNHETGEVRGLLCADSERGCNHAILGNIKDIDMAKRIVEYLENPPARRILGS